MMKRAALLFCFVITSLLIASAQQASTAQQLTPEDQVRRAYQQLNAWRATRTFALMNDFGELGRYRDKNAALPAPAPGENRVVFMGDSITDMWKLEQYFPNKPYINRGIGGQTTPQMLIRFRPDVIDLKPKVVVILAGTNDIAGNTGPMTLPEIEANLASMADLARAHNIRVVMSSVTPVHNYTQQSQPMYLTRPPEQIVALNKWIREYCQSNGCIYLDYFSAMVDNKGLLRKDLALDGLHPTAEGYAIMAPLAEAAIAKALASPSH